MQNDGHEQHQPGQRRQRPQQPQPDYVAAALGGIALGAAGYGAYKLYKALTSGENEHELNGTSWYQRPLFSNVPWTLNSFWNNVEEIQDEEKTAIEQEVYAEPERYYKHPYNKFDRWFENLLRNLLRFNDSETQEFKAAFDEIFITLLQEMVKVDHVFKFLFRKFYPAGSSWEDLKIYSSDEYDVNIVLFPLNIQKDVKVIYSGCGAVSVRLENGFSLSREGVMKRFPNNDRGPSYYESIRAKLNNWIDNSFVSRLDVVQWLQGTVDMALNELHKRKYEWTHIQNVTRSRSGPAVTLNVTMSNGKKFSVDLVPVFEFSQEHLPPVMKNKVRAESSMRTWFGVPKGPRKDSPPIMWRTSLYDVERDAMKDQGHLKPCIRIMKRLRDMREWKALSSYYIKTSFLWQMDGQNFKQLGLGQLMMLAMRSLEQNLQKQCIPYYWDESLNLLDNVNNKDAFISNVSGCLRVIIKTFERSLQDDSVNPMVYFGCDKNGNSIPSTQKVNGGVFPYESQLRGETSRNFNTPRPSQDELVPNCAIM